MTHRAPFQPLPFCDSVISLSWRSDLRTALLAERFYWRESRALSRVVKSASTAGMQLRVLLQLSLQPSFSSRNVKCLGFFLNFGKWLVCGFWVCLLFVFFKYLQLLFYSCTVCRTVSFEAFAISCTTVAYRQLGCSAGSTLGLPCRHFTYESCEQKPFLVVTVPAIPVLCIKALHLRQLIQCFLSWSEKGVQ